MDLELKLTMDRETMDDRDPNLSYASEADCCADLLRDGLLFQLAVIIATLNKRLFGSRVTEGKSSHSADSNHSLGEYCGF